MTQQENTTQPGLEAWKVLGKSGYDEDNDSACTWVFIASAIDGEILTEEQADRYMEERFGKPEDNQIHSDYDCTGRSFEMSRTVTLIDDIRGIWLCEIRFGIDC